MVDSFLVFAKIILHISIFLKKKNKVEKNADWMRFRLSSNGQLFFAVIFCISLNTLFAIPKFKAPFIGIFWTLS